MLFAVEGSEVAAWIAAAVGAATLAGLLWAAGRKLDQMTDAYIYVRRQMTGEAPGVPAKGSLRDAVDTGVTLTTDLRDRLESVASGIDEVKTEQAAIRAALVNSIHRDDQRFETVDRRLDDHDAEHRRTREVLRGHGHPELASQIDRFRGEVMAELEQLRGDVVALYERTEQP